MNLLSCQPDLRLAVNIIGPRAPMPFVMYLASTPTREVSAERRPPGPGTISAPSMGYT